MILDYKLSNHRNQEPGRNQKLPGFPFKIITGNFQATLFTITIRQYSLINENPEHYLRST